MKIKVKYFKLTVDGAQTFNFNGSGHCEQVLRGLVHSGHEVSVKELSEIKEVTQEQIDELRETDATFRYIDEPKAEKNCNNEATCMPSNPCR